MDYEGYTFFLSKSKQDFPPLKCDIYNACTYHIFKMQVHFIGLN